jgi:hypothetical protein
MKSLIEAFPQNIHDAIAIAQSSTIRTPKNEVHNIIICGLGGSGIVIIRYTGSQAATGGTVNPSVTPGYTIHTFTGPGSFNTNTAIAGTYSIN